MGDFNAEEIWFANAEADIRSIERAVRFLPNGFTGWVRLVENGVQIHIAQEEKSIDRLVAWHEMASWRCPMGGTQRAFHRNLYKNRNACFLIVTKRLNALLDSNSYGLYRNGANWVVEDSAHGIVGIFKNMSDLLDELGEDYK